jgi:hypothetical protein
MYSSILPRNDVWRLGAQLLSYFSVYCIAYPLKNDLKMFDFNLIKSVIYLGRREYLLDLPCIVLNTCSNMGHFAIFSTTI